MPGVIEVIATAPIGRVLNDLELLILCSKPEEYENRVLYVPLS